MLCGERCDPRDRLIRRESSEENRHCNSMGRLIQTIHRMVVASKMAVEVMFGQTEIETETHDGLNDLLRLR